MITALDCTIRLTRDDEFTHRKVEFSVPTDAKRIVVTARYTPKYLEDYAQAEPMIEACMRTQGQIERPDPADMRRCMPLSNHLSYSLDGPDGWLGTAHRHNPEQVLTVGAQATEGFFDTPILRAGDYALTISVNSIVTQTIDAYIRAEYEI